MPGLLNGAYSWASASYSQDSLTTFSDHTQYVIWVDEQRHARIAKRRVGKEWQSSVDLFSASSTGSGASLVGFQIPEDSHNVVSVAVDKRGFIHVSGGMHGGTLRYMRSANPHDLSSWVRSGMIGTEENSVTYPMFVKCLDGTLLFAYRNGASGNGDWFLNTFDPITQVWSRLGKWLDGITDSLSAYPQRIALDHRNGRLHAMWTWRDTGEASTNEDLCYAYSDNNGVTWNRMNGTPYTLPIRKSTSEVVLDTSTPGTLLNSGGLDVDRLGRPHCAFISDEPRQIHHLYWDGSAWQNDTITDFSGSYVVTRPSVAGFHDGTIWILTVTNAGGRGNYLRAFDVTDSENVTEKVLYAGDLLEYQPSFDSEAMRQRDTLYMIVAPMRSDGALLGDPEDLDAQAGVVVIGVKP